MDRPKGNYLSPMSIWLCHVPASQVDVIMQSSDTKSRANVILYIHPIIDMLCFMCYPAEYQVPALQSNRIRFQGTRVRHRVFICLPAVSYSGWPAETGNRPSPTCSAGFISAYQIKEAVMFRQNYHLTES